MAHTILTTLRKLNHYVAILIGVMLLTCAAVILLDIVMRQLGASLGGTDEISGYVMAIATSWGMGFTLLELGHVRIDLLRGQVSARGRALFDLGSMLVLSITVTLIAVTSWPVLARSITNSSNANTPLETPLTWVQTPWFLGWVWFAVVSWLTFVAAVMLVRKGEFSEAETAIGTFGEEETAL